MASFFQPLFRLFIKRSAEDKDLADRIFKITGAHPTNLNLYKLALRHSSVSQNSDSRAEHNERLEYLGDAVLGILIAEFLFKRFPFKNEGFLTEIRSRIVNGESLNILAGKIGLDKLIRYEGKRKQNHTHRSMYGDAMEALVGAVYLDLGFLACKSFVIDRLIKPNYDLDEVVDSETNHKSRLIEWAQRNGYVLKFDIIKEAGRSHTKEFTCQVNLSGTAFSNGSGYSKKRAEQDSAFKALEKIKSGKLDGLEAKPVARPVAKQEAKPVSKPEKQRQGNIQDDASAPADKPKPINQERPKRSQEPRNRPRPIASAEQDAPKAHDGERENAFRKEAIVVQVGALATEPIIEEPEPTVGTKEVKIATQPTQRKWTNVLKEDVANPKTEAQDAPQPSQSLNWDSEWDSSFGSIKPDKASHSQNTEDSQEKG